MAFRSSTMESDAARVSAAIPSGVGFLGAGLIWKGATGGEDNKRQEVHGLTTAASVWLSAAVGVGTGGRLYVVSVYAVFLVVFVLRLGPRMMMTEDRSFFDYATEQSSESSEWDETSEKSSESNIEKEYQQLKDEENAAIAAAAAAALIQQQETPKQQQDPSLLRTVTTSAMPNAPLLQESTSMTNAPISRVASSRRSLVTEGESSWVPSDNAGGATPHGSDSYPSFSSGGAVAGHELPSNRPTEQMRLLKRRKSRRRSMAPSYAS